MHLPKLPLLGGSLTRIKKLHPPPSRMQMDQGMQKGLMPNLATAPRTEMRTCVWHTHALAPHPHTHTHTHTDTHTPTPTHLHTHTHTHNHHSTSGSNNRDGPFFCRTCSFLLLLGQLPSAGGGGRYHRLEWHQKS